MTELHWEPEHLPHIPDNLTLAQFVLDYHHEIQPSRGKVPCLVDEISGRQISFEFMKSQTEDLANALFAEYQLGEEDTVMLLSPNHTNYPVALWAIHKLGGIVTCSNPQFKQDELTYQLQLANVNFVIAHSTLLPAALEATQAVGLPSNRVIVLDEGPLPVGLCHTKNVPELIVQGKKNTGAFHERSLKAGEGKTKVALLCWSSGTTGKSKAVAIPHCALIANIIQMAAHNQINKVFGVRDSRSYRPGDVALGVLPFYHVAGLVIGLHLTVFCAMTLVVVPKYDFEALLDTIQEYEISHLFLVPPQAIAFCKHSDISGDVYSKIKYVMIGAAPLSREIQERLSQVFPMAQIGQAYGLTEMTTTISMVPPYQRRGSLGSGGRLLPGIQARVLKADGSLAKYGERGELVVKGPAITLGYYNDVQATQETFIDGWVHTGDEVILTNEQEVFVFDRLKELLKVRGFQVAPAELEGCLLAHTDVAEACVVGIPDHYHGERPLAYIVLTTDAAACVARNSSMAHFFRESIIKQVEDHKASYKHLTGGVRFVESIPKNGSGKIMRRVLRETAKLASPPGLRVKL